MTAPLRCAILSAAHVHTPSYAVALKDLPQTELVAVWDDNAGRGEAFARTYGTEFVADLQTLLARSDVEAVIITSENVRHAGLCEAACASGKHVLCEKPLATTHADAARMIAAADRAGMILATAFPMRHNLPARAIKSSIEAGDAGQILTVRATNHGTLPPGWFQDPALAGGGAVMDHTVHVADLLRWYLGDDPTEVYAEIGHGLYHLPVDDSGFLTIAFRSGVVATLDPSWSRPPSFPTWGDVTMEIAGERGTLQLDAFAQKIVYTGGDGVAWLDWGTNADAAMIADFARAVREGVPPAATGRDGAWAMAVALAAYESARTGQPAPVTPPG